MTQNKISAIVFDKDGTIFDSEQIYCQSWVESARAFNVHFTAQMYDEFVGVRAAECFERAHKMFGPDFPMQDFIKYNRAWIDERKNAGMPIKPGFVEFFDAAKKTGLPLALVTSSAKESAEHSFTGTDFRQFFDQVVTGDQVANPKPSPECYQLASQKLAVPCNEMLVFEDSTAGVTAALEAGCQTVCIPDYLPVEPELLKRCAHVLNSFEDALFLLQDL
ncbi:HAD family hydrolase [Gayadomonas joobiniege]|uniref:HAD family hydrolase n=1 Tax=Gayadomonas joobiniege TaxID=1234606 RepID=UPI000379E5A9|nr:HAD family phosphatase [Gayadomonas joobiniege]